MCGISGGLALGDRQVDVAAVEALSAALSRRGPDGCGSWADEDGRVAFGHRRLAVIGLGPGGAQPMQDADGRYVITFNGEIYNYRELRAELEALGCRFRGDSDTEVVIHAVARWGEPALARLRGMFAFALWDAIEQELWLARDPFGIKPLYWSETPSTLWFSSQARPLASVAPVDADRDAAALVGFYLWGHVPEPFTWWSGIRSFPAGHLLRVRRDQPVGRPTPFLRLSDCFLAPPEPLAGGELRQLLEDSVAHHLIADIPVGVFLSAGIDSSVLAVLASRSVRNLATVTLAFEEFRGTPADEAPLAEATARVIGSDHTTWRMGRDEFDGLVDDFIAVMDQPTVDALNTYCVSYATARTGIKVALSGLGADELFGGYPSFESIPKWLRMRGLLPQSLQRFADPLTRALRRAGLPVKPAGLLRIRDVASAYLLRRSLHLHGELDRLLDESWIDEGLARLATERALSADTDLLAARDRGMRPQISLLETTWYMRNQLLRDTDWASMAHGLEVRVPFLDLPLLQRVSAAAASARPPTKQDLAACCEGLPRAVSERRKTGFATPVRQWIQAGPAGKGRGLKEWSAQVHLMFGRSAPGGAH